MILPILRKFSPCRSLSQKYTLYKKKLSLKTLSICPSWLMKSWSGYLEGIFIGDVLTGRSLQWDPTQSISPTTTVIIIMNIQTKPNHSDHHHDYTNQTKPNQNKPLWSSSLSLYKPLHSKTKTYPYAVNFFQIVNCDIFAAIFRFPKLSKTFQMTRETSGNSFNLLLPLFRHAAWFVGIQLALPCWEIHLLVMPGNFIFRACHTPQEKYWHFACNGIAKGNIEISIESAPISYEHFHMTAWCFHICVPALVIAMSRFFPPETRLGDCLASTFNPPATFDSMIRELPAWWLTVRVRGSRWFWAMLSLSTRLGTMKLNWYVPPVDKQLDFASAGLEILEWNGREE